MKQWNDTVIIKMIQLFFCKWIPFSMLPKHWSPRLSHQYIHIQFWRDSAKRREPSGVWWQDQRQWSQTEMQEVPSEQQETVCQLWTWPISGKGCPERWWSIHPCKYENVVQTWSWRTRSRCSCPSMGFGLGDLQRCLQTSGLLWFWYSVPLMYSYFCLSQRRANLTSFHVISIYLISAVST